jgi:hypothetical protein
LPDATDGTVIFLDLFTVDVLTGTIPAFVKFLIGGPSGKFGQVLYDAFHAGWRTEGWVTAAGGSGKVQVARVASESSVYQIRDDVQFQISSFSVDWNWKWAGG